MHSEKTGILFINLGTPAAATKTAVWKYLAEFLNDPQVIDLPGILRIPLLYGCILPLRITKVTRAYRAIWSEQGSPLRVHSQAFLHKITAALEQAFGPLFSVRLAMRYGGPSIATELKALTEQEQCNHVWIWPLYPQYAEASNGSALAATFAALSQKRIVPQVLVRPCFYQDPFYIQALAELYAPILSTLRAERILFSYHGLPERQLLKSGCKRLLECRAQECVALAENAPYCYRAQCFSTTHLVAKALGLSREQYAISFQSRLGRLPWITPYTEEVLKGFRTDGVERVAVACPSFVADCLETLEEIGVRAKEQWIRMGGKELILLPSLNAEDTWIQAVVRMVGSMAYAKAKG